MKNELAHKILGETPDSIKKKVQDEAEKMVRDYKSGYRLDPLQQFKKMHNIGQDSSEPLYVVSTIPPEQPALWQRCPICHGVGEIFPEFMTTSTGKITCPTCKGKRIISTLTGHPPQDVETEPVG